MNEHKKLKVCWISSGVSSLIAAWLARDTIDRYIYIDIADQHSDSLRFIDDCEKVLGKKIERLQSSEYKSVEDAIRAAGVISMKPSGFAPCTAWLKKRVRKAWEWDHRDYDITYVWGFDCNESNRAERLRDVEIEFHHKFPLIEKNLTKEDAHAMLAMLKIKRPAMYDMGYRNNNCIGCVKGGMGYWNKIRIDFPDVFASRAKMERDIGHSCLKECYLDELDPARGRFEEEISQECSLFCMMVLED